MMCSWWACLMSDRFENWWYLCFTPSDIQYEMWTGSWWTCLMSDGLQKTVFHWWTCLMTDRHGNWWALCLTPSDKKQNNSNKNPKCFAVTSLLSRNNRCVLLWQTCFCHDKTFVATSIFLSQQKMCFVMTNVHLSWQTFVCHDKTFVYRRLPRRW